MQRSLKWFAVGTTLVMIFILLGGALVTKTDSGMGCGRTWPLCHGEFMPTEITPELLIELAHRLVSGAGGLMVLVLSIWTWKTIGHIRETKFLSVLSFFFLMLQALIGAAAVKWGQSDFVLALHFGISLISFASVFLLTLLIFEVDKKFEADKLVIDKRMKFHTIALSIYTYLVIYTGALVRHMNASLVCPDWPFCVNSSPAMPDNIYVWVQMGHRVAAGMIFIWIAYIAIMAFKNYRQQKVIYWGWMIALILVSLQVIAGALIIFTRLNLIIALSHAFFITSLFGLLSYFILLISRSSKNSR
ncbi:MULTISPECIES: heme A synthase [unclassified Bacillus (in: firmicutes)]|uniref:COX15/CtaA family protein n=1 Tax=unclassified Bacillus (in: firmicutes) TaxID=185979 RepID=UPI0008E05B8E|nr:MULTISPECIES: heme A synthase [unclassified Bacillus (in: firmicutes)]SFA76139.1 cytochrome c oxidase assembly protein subunit 15 [Bacillus sp. UNCCL13]SFQ66064.1 cytochrome c oxidase assembly protein subunit 15 [Bacillus sp. cl95]